MKIFFLFIVTFIIGFLSGKYIQKDPVNPIEVDACEASQIRAFSCATELKKLKKKVESQSIEAQSLQAEEDDQSEASVESGLETNTSEIVEKENDEEEVIEEDLDKTPMDQAREEEEEKEKLSVSEKLSKSRPLNNITRFNRILNGMFKGKASVSRQGQKEDWDVELESYYTGSRNDISGHSKIEVKREGETIFQTNYQGENKLYSSYGKDWFFELGPGVTLKINKRNSKRIKGTIYESQRNGISLKKIGNFNLKRVSF